MAARAAAMAIITIDFIRQLTTLLTIRKPTMKATMQKI